MKPDESPVDPAELSVRYVLERVADADERLAVIMLLGDMASFLRVRGRHDGGHACLTYLTYGRCVGCDLIRRFEALTQSHARIMGDYRARFGDLGGGTA